jgi:hypothetical protein
LTKLHAIAPPNECPDIYQSFICGYLFITCPADIGEKTARLKGIGTITEKIPFSASSNIKGA